MLALRKPCEYNGYEYMAAILLAKHAGKISVVCNTIDDIFGVSPNCIESAHAPDYLMAMTTVNKRYANHWIQQFNSELVTHPFPNIEKVYLCGKSELPDIKELNRPFKRVEKKGDVYIKTSDNTFVAFSIKQSTGCTKTNWSVERILPSEELKQTRIQYLKENGFETFQKSERKRVNSLFYGTNPYFTLLRKKIEEHKQNILDQFGTALYGIGLPYPLYEFDSTSLKWLNGTKIDTMSFDEYDSYYLTKKGDKKSTAKLFYKLQMNDQTYRVEVRWKGNVFTSPQFHTHMEN